MAKKIDTKNELPEGLEIRTLSMTEGELRVSDDDATKIEGYTAKFNKWSSNLGWFREKIDPGAFDGVLNDDVRALKNHDPNLILGRTKSKTLRLKVDKTGLHYSVDVPNTTTGSDTVEEIRRGDISGNSFAFTVAEDSWNYDTEPMERTIIRCDQLFDVGPVCYPAYPDTTVAARSLDAHKAALEVEKPPDESLTEEEIKEEFRQVDEERTESNASPENPDGAETEETPTPLTPEKKRALGVAYRKLGRIINRCRSAES